MSATLSKKQQKALAFRQKKKGKPELDVADVPEHDLDADADTVIETIQPPTAPGKRKRQQQTEQLDEASPEPVKKKQKSQTDDIAADESKGNDEANGNEKRKAKFILFLGNLRYTTSIEQIAKHFEACTPPPTIRLLTPKPRADANGKTRIAKSKGCAFLEFASHNTLQQALKLHGSELDGRTINVELTAGGGGKSTARLAKVRERNKSLMQERKKRLVKSAAVPDENAAAESLKPQRHSNTSGVDRTDTVAKRRTWSIPEGNESAGRGGVKHKKRGKKTKQSQPWASGANAIAVE